MVTNSPPLLSTRRIVAIVVWAAALFGTLQIHQYPNLFGHSVCGPWGCGPPTSALVSYHGFWFVLILPAAWILSQLLSASTTHKLGLGLLLASVAGIAALLLLEGLDNSAAEQYLLRWCLFRVATFVDVPLVQLGLAGLLMRWQAARRLREPNDSKAEESTSHLFEV